MTQFSFQSILETSDSVVFFSPQHLLWSLLLVQRNITPLPVVWLELPGAGGDHCPFLRECWVLYLLVVWVMPGTLYRVSSALSRSKCVSRACLPQWHPASTPGHHLSCAGQGGRVRALCAAGRLTAMVTRWQHCCRSDNWETKLLRNAGPQQVCGSAKHRTEDLLAPTWSLVHPAPFPLHSGEGSCCGFSVTRRVYSHFPLSAEITLIVLMNFNVSC